MKIIFETIRFIRLILPKQYKLRAIGIGILLFINSGLELLGLGALYPVFAVLLVDSVVEKFGWAKWIYNSFGMTDERQLIVVLAVALFVIFIIKNLLSLWITKIQSIFSLSLYREFTLKLHEIYYRRGFSFFKTTNSNIIMRDIKVATERFSQSHVLGLLNFANEIVVLLAIVISIAIYDIRIFVLLLLTVIPPFYFFYRWVGRQSITLSAIRNRIEPIIGKNIFQSINGYVDIIISGSEKVFRKRIEENVEELVNVNVKTNIYNLAPTRVIETFLMLAIAIMIAYGIYYLPSKADLVKLLGLFAIAGYRILPSINRMMIAINGINQNYWVFKILTPLISEKINKIEIEKEVSFKNHLKLKHINFAYSENTKNILTDYSLTIKKGEVIGLVGPSGAGKTTIMNILLGFLIPQKGTYEIDDVILTTENLKSFYKKVGYVQQQVYLVDGTISENVAFGCENHEIDIEKLKKVLDQASLTEFMANLPDGINTMIGENGAKLSGGQRQRIGIARALYFNAEILFFDEATSSLDIQTEKDITESINKLADGKLTMIIIAHQLSTLKSCDRIEKIIG